MQSNDSDKAPETISKAVASLPPEQMFELLKQMKQCVQVWYIQPVDYLFYDINFLKIYQFTE